VRLINALLEVRLLPKPVKSFMLVSSGFTLKAVITGKILLKYRGSLRGAKPLFRKYFPPDYYRGD
jgi:hypothetical protein